MTKLLAILLVALVVETYGVVFLSRGLRQLQPAEFQPTEDVVRLALRAVRHPDIWIGVALEAAFFGALLYLLSQRDVSLLWPLTSLGFLLTTLAARFHLGEHVSTTRWCGVALIVLGAALVTYSESQRPAPASSPNSPPAQADRHRTPA
jgi:drug/metabolite transporter (DMT)-like permease